MNKPKDSIHDAPSKFLVRMAENQKSEALMKTASEKEEFESSYRKGKMRYAVASKFLPLTSRGLNTYTEGDLNIVWVRDGDSICRVENDLSWVDEFLNTKEETK